MQPEDRIIVAMPLAGLWDEDGDLSITRKRDLGRKELVELLRKGPVQFVVANCGDRPLWFNLDIAYRLWKNEVKPRLVEPNEAATGFRLENFPGEYCYLATEWDPLKETPVVLLEMYH